MRTRNRPFVFIALAVVLAVLPRETSAAYNWTGTFKGPDTVGQEMTITLTQQQDKVNGNWTFTSKGKDAGQKIEATITVATVSDNTLTGSWTQTPGADVPLGSFEWTWLEGSCDAFKGTFNGTEYWKKMTRQ